MWTAPCWARSPVILPVTSRRPPPPSWRAIHRLIARRLPYGPPAANDRHRGRGAGQHALCRRLQRAAGKLGRACPALAMGPTPTEGLTLRYQVEPLQAGVWPTNVRAAGRYTDGVGYQGDLVFPVPVIEVLGGGLKAYLPMVFQWSCPKQRSDVLLVIDTSSSMDGIHRPADRPSWRRRARRRPASSSSFSPCPRTAPPWSASTRRPPARRTSAATARRCVRRLIGCRAPPEPESIAGWRRRPGS